MSHLELFGQLPRSAVYCESCGRRLKDPKSKAAGIGRVCAAKQSAGVRGFLLLAAYQLLARGMKA